MKCTSIFWSTLPFRSDKRSAGTRTPQRIGGGSLLLLALLAFSVQGCLGIGGSNGKQIATGSNGQQVSVNQDVFTGKFYLTINHNLYVLNGNNTTQELVNTGNVYDPAVSPDGKWVAFIEKYKEYSNLCVISTSGGAVRVLRNGNGHFYYVGPYIHNNYYWYAQPAWSPDGSTLLFLSDLGKKIGTSRPERTRLCSICRFSRSLSTIPRPPPKMSPMPPLVLGATAIPATGLDIPTRLSTPIMLTTRPPAPSR